MLHSCRIPPTDENIYLFAFVQDPFGDLIKKIMHVIQEHAQLQPTCELGSQKYELWVIQMERKGEWTHLIVAAALP